MSVFKSIERLIRNAGYDNWVIIIPDDEGYNISGDLKMIGDMYRSMDWFREEIGLKDAEPRRADADSEQPRKGRF